MKSDNVKSCLDSWLKECLDVDKDDFMITYNDDCIEISIND